MAKKVEYATVAEFAKIMGVSATRVYALIDKGKLTCKIQKGKKTVPIEKGKKEWASLDKTAAKKNPSGKKGGGSKQARVNAPPPAEAKTFKGLSIADAERQEKYYKAQLQELKYKEQAGELIEVSTVKTTTFETARKLRDALLTIPTTICHEIAAETDPHTVEIKLSKILVETLEKFTGGKK